MRNVRIWAENTKCVERGLASAKKDRLLKNGNVCTHLIEVIGLQNSAGNDANSGSHLSNNLDLAEENVFAGGNGRCVLIALNFEYCAQVLLVLNVGGNSGGEGLARTLGKITVDAVGAKGRIGRAG